MRVEGETWWVQTRDKWGRNANRRHKTDAVEPLHGSNGNENTLLCGVALFAITLFITFDIDICGTSVKRCSELKSFVTCPVCHIAPPSRHYTHRGDMCQIELSPQHFANGHDGKRDSIRFVLTGESFGTCRFQCLIFVDHVSLERMITFRLVLVCLLIIAFVADVGRAIAEIDHYLDPFDPK